MINANLIERALEARDFDRLLRELADNGLAMPLSLRMQLAQSETATIALGLRRLVELTYGPTVQSRRLTDRLLNAQLNSGLFDSGDGPDLLTTVLALAALTRVADDHAPPTTPATSAPGSTTGNTFGAVYNTVRRDAFHGVVPSGKVSKSRLHERDRVVTALDRGFAALAEAQDCDGLFTAGNDRTLADRALTSAFVVSLMGQDARFRRSVRVHDIHRWFEERDGRLDRTTRQLWDLASVCIDDVIILSPALAA